MSIETSMSITKKLIALFLIVSLIPLLVLSLVLYSNARSSLERTTLNTLQMLAAEKEGRIRSVAALYYEQSDTALAASTLTQTVQSVGTGSAVSALKAEALDIQERFSDIKGVTVLGADSQPIASTFVEDQVVSPVSAREIERLKSGSPTMSIIKLPNGSLGVVASRPVSVDNTFVGTVQFVYSADALLAAMNNVEGLGQSGEYYLLHRADDGTMVVLTPLRNDPSAPLTQRFTVSDPRRPSTQALENRQATFTNLIDYRNQPVLVATRYLDDLDWGLVVKQDRSEALQAVRSLRDLIIIFGVILTIVVFILSFELTRLIVRPLNRITEATKRYARGDFAQRVTVESSDELGGLALSVNHMATELQSLYTTMEQRIRENTATLEAAQEIAHVGSWRWNPTKRFMEWSPELFRILGLDLLKRPTYRQYLERVHPDDREVFEKMVQRARTSGKPMSGIHRIIRRDDGSTRVLEIRGERLAGSSSRNARLLGTARDITEQYELQQRQREFVSIASHELRTPITALMGYLAMMKNGAPAERLPQFTDRAFDAALRLSKLIEDLLNVARLEEGRTTLSYELIKPSKLVTEVVRDLRPSFAARKTKLTYKDALKESDRIRVDSLKLRQVLSNILDNANKYTPNGGKVTVETFRSGRHVAFRVTDTGIGIHKDNLRRIYDKFFREYTSLSVKAGGTGLGLFITKELIERMSGQLAIESEQDVGTTVTILFPRRQA
jgi:PAS domain S-box-containing protein